MISPLQKKLTALVLCIALLCTARHAKAQSGIGISNGEAVGIVAAMAAVAVAIGVGIYLVVRHPSSVTGCAAAEGNSVTLLSEADGQTYALSGDIANIKPGERVHVSGKKKKDSAGHHTLTVGKVVKDYGPCKVSQ